MSAHALQVCHCTRILRLEFIWCHAGPIHCPLLQIRAGEPDDAKEFVIGTYNTTFNVEVEEAEEIGLEDPTQTLLGSSQRLCSLFAFGDVERKGNHSLTFTGDESGDDEHRHTAAVGADELFLERRRRTSLPECLHMCQIALEILGRSHALPIDSASFQIRTRVA